MKEKQQIMIMANPRTIAEEYFGAIPKRDVDRARELLHPEYSYAGGDGQRREGPDAGIEVIETYTQAFSDLQIEIQNMYEAGNIVVTEFVGTGTHSGDLMGIKPTGKSVKIPICNVIEIRDDKIYAEREYFDSAVMLQQLGVDIHKQPAVA